MSLAIESEIELDLELDIESKIASKSASALKAAPASEIALVVGIDEAGRGPLAGPVVAAAVILHPQRVILGLKDSKKLSAKQRARLFEAIVAQAAAYGIGAATVLEIEALNILQATFLAMRRAVAALPVTPTFAWVDGNQDPGLICQTQCVIQGDQLVPAISAASILAKVTRDRWMEVQDARYPGYGFAQHKGYGTRQHYAAIAALGLTALHRKSFCSRLMQHSR